jgi:hypothetical protein
MIDIRQQVGDIDEFYDERSDDEYVQFFFEPNYSASIKGYCSFFFVALRSE